MSSYKSLEEMDPVNVIKIMKRPKRYRKSVRFCIISDTHGKHEKLGLEEYGCDVLIHCGDFTTWSDWRSFGHLHKVPQSAIDFNNYLGKLRHFRHKIIAIGNHDEGFVAEYCKIHKFPEEKRMDLARRTISNGTILDNDVFVIEGIKIFVLSYNYKKYDRKTKWKEVERMIPSDIDILVCHFPPKFAGDRGLLNLCHKKLKNLKVVCSGHFHKMYYVKKSENITFVSAPSFSRKTGQKPVIVFDLYV